ncbi:MAG: hypothetical protein QOH84_2575, partial [Kribbellaceae bacterium]|nr:hypothetical protein [Kribbellaceae bacterium]
MSIARTLVGLYPRAVRDRWGPELEDQAAADGCRSWPGLLAAMVGLWMHPAIWPARSVSHRRARAANLTVAVTGAGSLIGHALLELSASVPGRLAHSWILDLCDAITFAGFVLVLPLPRPAAWIRVLALATRRLAVPILIAAGVVVAANNYPATPRVPTMLAWWFALVLGVVQSVRTVASIDLAAAPGARRLRVGLWFAVLGLTLSSAVVVVATLNTGADIAAGVGAGG